MAIKKRGLGKNSLDVLLSNNYMSVANAETEKTLNESQDNEDMRYLPVEMINKGRYQPRRHIDPTSIEELATSIRAHGVIQPIVVRELNKNHYELIAGERRWRASQLAGLDTIPAIVRKLPDEAAMAIGLIENIQRENLNPIEEAKALARLIDEFGMTQQQLADAIGKSRSAITNLLRLLKLEHDVSRLLENGDIEVGHAKALLALEHAQQKQIAKKIIERELSVREAEKLIRHLTTSKHASAATTSNKPVDPDVVKLENDISDRLGAKVRVNHQSNGKGKLVIHYNNLDELDGILDHLR